MSAVRKKNVANIRTSYAEQYAHDERNAAKKRKLLFRRLTAFFIFITVVSYFVVSSLIAQSATLDNKMEEKKALESKLASLEKEQQMLEEEIVKLNDDEYLAKLARRDYFLSGDNEIIFNLPKKEKDPASN